MSYASERLKWIRYSRKYGHNTLQRSWVENLLNIQIADNRKFALWRIIGPYLLNVKGLTAIQSKEIMIDWLMRCSKLRPITFDAEQRINDALNGASKGYKHISKEKLQQDNLELYKLIFENQK